MGFNDQQNKRISNWIIDELRLNPISDSIPKKVNDLIQPTFEVNKKFSNLALSSAIATTSSQTLLTTSSTEDTYITSAHLSIAKDVACDVATGRYALVATINGASRDLLSIAVLTLTAQNQSVSISFADPVKIDRNTTIALQSAAFTAGLYSRSGAIFGYTQSTGDATP